MSRLKFRWQTEIPLAAEWFDLDRSDNMSDDYMDERNIDYFENIEVPPEPFADTLEAAIERAKKAGFTVETYAIMPGTTGYQLRSPHGEYVQFGGSETGLWKNAWINGHLPRPI